jgi:hypothetical protein
VIKLWSLSVTSFSGGTGKIQVIKFPRSLPGPGTATVEHAHKKDDKMRKTDLKNRSLDEFFAKAIRVDTANSPHGLKAPGGKMDPVTEKGPK